MVRSIPVKQKKRGRPATGHDPLIGVRFPAQLTASVDHFGAERDMSRSEAVRYLVEQALEMFSQANRGKRK